MNGLLDTFFCHTIRIMITKLFAQTDGRWAKELLGNNTEQPFNIGGYGCLVTAYGNMLCAITGNLEYTPEFINNYMKANNGFVGQGGLFIWNQALSLGHVETHGTTTNLSEVNKWLQDPPNFAILEVRASRTLQHFVMAPYVDKIVDSEDGLLKSMGTYPFIAAHLYRSTDPITEPSAPPAAPAATPEPATSGSVTITATPFLNLRTGPGTNFPIGKGSDGSGHTIYNLPPGAVVGYVDAVQADSNSSVQGVWLKSSRGNYYAASGTNYQS
jgi:hypothetical protein